MVQAQGMSEDVISWLLGVYKYMYVGILYQRLNQPLPEITVKVIHIVSCLIIISAVCSYRIALTPLFHICQLIS